MAHKTLDQILAPALVLLNQLKAEHDAEVAEFERFMDGDRWSESERAVMAKQQPRKLHINRIGSV